MHKRKVLSFFRANKISAPIGLLLGAILLSSKLSLIHSLNTPSSSSDRGRNGRKGGDVPLRRSIAWSALLLRGRLLAHPLMKKASNPLRRGCIWGESFINLPSSAIP